MSNYLKYFKSEFEKYAQGLDMPPSRPSRAGGGAGTPAARPAPRGQGGGGTPGGPPSRPSATPQAQPGAYVNPVPDIKNMQEAMQEFASVATSYGAAHQQSGPPGKQPPAKVDSRKKQFNDFITEQYLANSDLKGEEFTPDEKRTAKEQKQPSDLIEMNIVVNGLQRIGSPQSELKADNMWDFRTNNALKNIYAFAYGLVTLSKDFGRTDAQSFTDADLGKMKELIPEDRDPKDIPAAEKSTKAKALTPLIKKLTKFYKYYISNIAMHPGFTRYIAGDESMMTLQKGGGDPTALDKDQQAMMGNIDNLQLGANAIPYITNKYPLNLPSPKGQGGVIGFGSMPLSVLQNVNTLRAFMTSNLGIPQNQTGDPRYLRATIDAIMKHVQSVLDLPEAQEKAATPPTPPSQQAGAGDLSGQPNQGVRTV